MKKFEYKYERTENEQFSAEKLNEFGSQGWQLVVEKTERVNHWIISNGLQCMESSVNVWTYTFMRELL